MGKPCCRMTDGNGKEVEEGGAVGGPNLSCVGGLRIQQALIHSLGTKGNGK